MHDFDLIVIGSGPGGQRAAVQAAKLKKNVAIVEGRNLGGSCLHWGTIPSKSLREAALQLDRNDPGALQKAQEISQKVILADGEIIRLQLERNKVEVLHGFASFIDPHRIEVKAANTREISAGSFVLATGNRPRRPDGICFEPPIYDSDTILSLKRKPKSLAVMGAGVIGCEYASIFAALGAEVSLYDRRKDLLRDLDLEILEGVKTAFVRNGISLRLGESQEVAIVGSQAKIKTVHDEKMFDAVLYCQGRKPNVEELRLDRVGLSITDKGTIAVNSKYQTSVPHIYAVGDLQGMPGLATSASEQGRMASAEIFGLSHAEFPETFPYGIYTIPELSWVGKTESQLKEQAIPFAVGRARFRELARGKILGDEDGFLKILFHRETRKILGVHAMGTQATELIHIGQVAMALGGGLDFFVSNVFNYPTFAEAYKVAAFQAFNELS